jgi:hypothetical protein
MGVLMRSWWCWLNREPTRPNKRKRKEAVMKEAVLRRRWQIVAKTDIERGASKIGKGDAVVRSFLAVIDRLGSRRWIRLIAPGRKKARASYASERQQKKLRDCDGLLRDAGSIGSAAS